MRCHRVQLTLSSDRPDRTGFLPDAVDCSLLQPQPYYFTEFLPPLNLTTTKPQPLIYAIKKRNGVTRSDRY